MRCSIRKKILAFFLIVSVLLEPIPIVLAKRGGGGGASRGSSAGRSSSGGFGGSRSRGGHSSGGYHPSSHNTGGSSYPRNNNYGLGNTNRQQSSGGVFGGSSNNNNRQGGGIFGGSNRNTGGSGGIFGGNNRQSYPQSNSKFRSGSGIGSMVRSNTFKNAIVGAAAGYLLYQGGKHLIRSAMSPMMWNNRPYYWGSNYYQPRPNYQMCRMPVTPGDPQFGNIYFQDQTRPKEIVWSCGMGEMCCGYECCPGGGYGNQGYNQGGYNQGYGNGYGGWNSGYRSFGFGSLLVLLLISCCACAIVYRICNRNSNTYQRAQTY